MKFENDLLINIEEFFYILLPLQLLRTKSSHALVVFTSKEGSLYFVSICFNLNFDWENTSYLFIIIIFMKILYYLFQLYILPMNKENFILNSNKKSSNTVSLMPKSSSKPGKTQPKQILSSRNDQHDDYMRLIIAKNPQYFKNKIKGPKSGCGKELKLKIPCQTDITVYRKDYKQKQPKTINKHQIQHSTSVGNLKNVSTLKMCIQDIKLDQKTNYQQDFKKHLINSLSCRRFNNKINMAHQDYQLPGFFQTQNKSNFLNWGGQNYVQSTKPAYKSAVTNLAFQGTSSYRSEFDGKQVKTTPICINQPSFPKFGNISMITKSKYSHDFPKKKNNTKQPNFKPKDTSLPLPQHFTGATEYKRQFKKVQNQQSQEMKQFETIQDLQNLIIDL